MSKYLFSLLLLFCISNMQAQQKKQLEHEDFDHWKKISASAISNNGQWILYEEKPGYGDPDLVISNANGVNVLKYQRAYNAAFNYTSTCVLFMIKPQLDSLNKKRRFKVKEEDLPKDSLAVYELSTQKLSKVAGLKSYKLPQKWGTHIAYQVYGSIELKKSKNDSLKTDEKKKVKKEKKTNDKNGYSLIIKDLIKERQDTFPYVQEYLFAEEGKKLLFSSTGNDSLFLPGVYVFNLENNKLIPLCRGKGVYKNLNIHKSGEMATFHADRDTTKERIRPYELFFWKEGNDSAHVLVDNFSGILPENWIISENAKPWFSDNMKFVFFGSSPRPLLIDTMLLPEEIVNVEVWNYKDYRLYTQQNAELKEDQKKWYPFVYRLDSNIFIKIFDNEIDEYKYSDKYNSTWVLGISADKYKLQASWEGDPFHYDIYKINLLTGVKQPIIKDIRASRLDISPGGKYICWFSDIDSAWFIHHNQSGITSRLMDNSITKLTDELNDIPNFPNPYGIAGWTTNDSLVLVYDRYDIWLVDPKSAGKPLRITNGRPVNTVFRYIRTDKESPFIDFTQKQLMESFNEVNKQDGFWELNLKKLSVKMLISGDFRLQYFSKARLFDKIIFSKENFTTFPDLLCSDFSFKKTVRISHVNPIQNDYLWGSAELFKWKSADGIEMQGLLYKPAEFNPQKKYPMLVNFYERSADNLFRYIVPEPHRSTINYSFYTSRGYLVFVPDIVYKSGYPGESCYNSVIPGVESLIEKGFVDQNRIGVQGHSWGAYQIAYLLTRTDIFAAAEAGAPVPNMISAYGGIRWQTGLSRMFQYEHGQSRIGANLWEDRNKYIDNSPIFFLDKVNTPLLLMHNDNDGHVPWYQGIEYYVAMRRLGKPVWMLNYNGEPHWPLKWQNQKDFNIRMQQFFDHFLKGDPMPEWMDKGIPAIEKGIRSGYDEIKNR